MASENNTDQQYIPGVCNIGPKEINSRMWFVRGGFILTMIAGTVARHYHHPPAVMAVLFILLSATLVSGLQIRFKFCVAFGVLGIWSFDGHSKKLRDEQRAFFNADRIKALKLVIMGTLIAAVLTVLFSLF